MEQNQDTMIYKRNQHTSTKISLNNLYKTDLFSRFSQIDTC